MKIKYYYSVASPFAYLAIDRFIKLVKKYNLQVEEKPFDLVGKVFPNTGGLPVPKRHPSRLKYRLAEIDRIGKKYNININSQPKFFPPSDPHIPAKFVIAAIEKGNLLTFGRECLSYLWAKEKDISDLNVIKEICNNLNLNFDELKSLSENNKIISKYESNSNDAISEDVFGAPSFIFNNEIFWGQDRLEYLEDKLK
ncbi:MAG: 2-hydroxychromene-2-carboxylate isomerase [Pelagibacteraceae bacterium]|nr:2-hydroxychromene-2-carboxylate isomerase [Pelagibacteraceae bacterium]MCI5078994.1 2-hydroxychromene-2-carboxylate isomerase [Pelagibacteraceae bacterium]